MKKYSIGLDVGTDSVGWACVDENDQLIKHGRKTLWGVRMFEASKDASERRAYRNNRRRLNRRHQRIALLRGLFLDEINKVDTTFFERLDDSFYHREDKRNKNVYNLFNGEYTDKEYYAEFPTIFHLRKHLMESNQKEDIRFIYLAMHHIIKYRGNFLTPGDVFNKGNIDTIKEVFSSLNDLLDDYANTYEDNQEYFQRIDLKDDDYINLESILVSPMGKQERKMKLLELFNVSKKTLVNECIIPLLVGNKYNFSSILVIKENKYEKCEISLLDEGLESIIEEKESIVPEFSSLFEFLIELKKVYDYYFLVKLLNNSDTLSDAMIHEYNQHNLDLNRLKAFIKSYAKDKYYECFRKYDSKLNNYVHYVGMNSTNKVMKRFSHCKREEFYKYLNDIFKNIKDKDAEEDIKYFQFKIENNELLLRQDSDQNGALPMQLHLFELRKILKNQAQFYPFLLEEDSDGLTVIDKIEAIFKFKLPYYVGPLNTNSSYSWVKRTNEKIYPWNYEKVIDLDETAKEFIQRMQNKCTYLNGKDDYCLPKNSLLFSEYNVLSFLNKISINGALITQELKSEIYQNVFLKVKKPTKKNIIDYLKANYGKMTFTNSKNELPEVNCDMSSYIKFKEIFGEEFEAKRDLIERIIKDICIFEDKAILVKRLKEIYKLSKDEIKKIKDLNYKKYGSLCKNLIDGIKVEDPFTGEVYGTLIDIMRRTNCNLQEVLYDSKYRLIDRIDEYNTKLMEENDVEGTFEDFLDENIMVSPVMRRAFSQTMNIIEEVTKIMGTAPEKYYIECTRTNKAEKKATDTRYKQLKEKLKEASKLAIEFGIDIKKLNKELDSHQDNIKSDAIYLYFSQLGRCMYSMEPIDLDNLLSINSDYDIDHIYPQALVKDDSLNNRVLELKKWNNKKSDYFLFDIDGLRKPEAFKFYDMLLDMKLITVEKHRRLTQVELRDNELDGFVNRQLVVTNQAVKALITTLKLYKHVDPKNIIYSKAENVSDFRREFNVLKSRTANNFHHAHDAYLNAVVGRALNNYFIAENFTNHQDYLRLRSEDKSINPMVILKKNRYFNGKCIWNKDYEIALINKNVKTRFDIMETLRTYNPNEMFKKVSILPAGNENAVPVKVTTPAIDIMKYGGINSNSYCKYVILKQDEKGVMQYYLEAIPKIYEKREFEYLQKKGFNNFEIVHHNIKSNVAVIQDKKKYYITGVSSEQFLIKNAIDRIFSYDSILTIKKIDKYMDNKKNNIFMSEDKDKIIISKAKNQNNKEIVLFKNDMVFLLQEIKAMLSKEIYDFSISRAILGNYDLLYSLSLEDLVYTTFQLLSLLKTNERATADLLNIGLSKKTGVLRISHKLLPGMKFVSESVTGYYSKIIFEVPSNGI